MKKCIGILIILLGVGVFPLLAYQSLQSVTVSANGNLPATVQFDVKIVGGKRLNFSSQAGQAVVSCPQYLQITFSNNSPGYQTILIYTDNRNPLANPLYKGTGSGAGIIGVTDPKVDTPLHWVVFDNPIPGGYKFVSGHGQPIDPNIQFFVQDVQQDKASFHVNPYDVGYGSMIFGLASSQNFKGNLAKAPFDDGHGGYRITKDGVVYIYLGANYTGKKKQTYQTNTLNIVMATITDNAVSQVLAQKTIPVAPSVLK